MTVKDGDRRAGHWLGVARDGAVSWRGIRYAHGPRFALPEPLPAPGADVLCDRHGPASAQPGGPIASASLADDALFLNVHAPAADGRRRPVLLWVHGGAFVFGAGAQYDGAPLARAGDIVVVTVNYRLGALGFVDFGALGVPRNLGLHDQLAALRWVREHIEAFGGDPERITLAGESAGAMSVASLMAAPAARGLFRGAILQSGALNLMHEAPLAGAIGQRMLALLERHGENRAALLRAPVQRLFAAQRRLAREYPGILPGAPVFDGDLLPPALAQARAAAAPVPLLLGWNRDEVRLFELPGLRGMLPLDRTALLRRLSGQLGAATAAALAQAYPDGPGGLRELATDAYFAQPVRRAAERHAAAGQPTWAYRFDRRGLLGAPHAAELAYLWDWGGLPGLVLRGGLPTPDRRRLGERMRRHWLGFVRDGRPGDDWPRYTPETPALKLFDREDRVAVDPEPHRRRAWGPHELVAAPP